MKKAEQSAEKIAEAVRTSNFEHSDFKIAFSISVEAYLRRLLVITRAEQALRSDFSHHFNKTQMRGAGNFDFKEVFKWILSPLLARALSLPANLEGTFLVNCLFQRQSKGDSAEESKSSAKT